MPQSNHTCRLRRPNRLGNYSSGVQNSRRRRAIQLHLRACCIDGRANSASNASSWLSHVLQRSDHARFAGCKYKVHSCFDFRVHRLNRKYCWIEHRRMRPPDPTYIRLSPIDISSVYVGRQCQAVRLKIAGKQRTCEVLVDDGFNALQSTARSFNVRNPASAGAYSSHTVAHQCFDLLIFIRAMVSVRILSLAAIQGWVSAKKIVKLSVLSMSRKMREWSCRALSICMERRQPTSCGWLCKLN